MRIFVVDAFTGRKFAGNQAGVVLLEGQEDFPSREFMQELAVDAYCRNFAPLYGIQEVAATGTSNGALTYYLKNYDLIEENMVNTFLQGEAMKKPSRIYTKIRDGKIQVGGTAKINLECMLFE